MLTYNFHTHTMRCRHASGEDREYEVEVLDSCIRVSCSVCGDYVDIPTDTLIGAYDFLGATSLELYPNGECPQ